MTPAWIPDIAAALMLAIATVSATRLAAARPRRPGSIVTEADVAHLLMAIAMAGMLTPRLAALPATAWDIIFGLLTAWFGYRVVRDASGNGARALPGGRCAPHLVHSAAMLYMFLALASRPAGAASGMGAMGGAGRPAMLQYPTLAAAFALVLVGYSIRDLDQLSGRHHSPAGARLSLAGAAAKPATEAAAVTLPAGATAGCRIAIGVIMALMLVLMI